MLGIVGDQWVDQDLRQVINDLTGFRRRQQRTPGKGIRFLRRTPASRRRGRGSRLLDGCLQGVDRMGTTQAETQVSAVCGRQRLEEPLRELGSVTAAQQNHQGVVFGDHEDRACSGEQLTVDSRGDGLACGVGGTSEQDGQYPDHLVAIGRTGDDVASVCQVRRVGQQDADRFAVDLMLLTVKSPGLLEVERQQRVRVSDEDLMSGVRCAVPDHRQVAVQRPAVRIGGRTATAPSGNGRILVTKEPVGPCLAVTPWNFPLAMGTRKIGPALAAGCTVIVKPAEDSPLTMLLLAQVFAEAGLPAGVLSLVPGLDSAGIVGALMADPRLRKVSFTGSTRVGKILIAQSATHVLRTSMELGGNAPFIVFDDADLDKAVYGALAAKMRNGGQACTAANRFLVHNGVREEFTATLAARLGALRTGPGWESGTELGPIINQTQLSRIAQLIDEAVVAGATVRTGAKAVAGEGFFYAPTVLDEVPADARIRTEEIFGPVAVIEGFDTEAQAIEAANSTEFGLAAYFFTEISTVPCAWHQPSRAAWWVSTAG